MRRLYTDSPIRFENPYVLQIDLSNSGTYSDATISYRKITREIYKRVSGTWGFSAIREEQVAKYDPVLTVDIRSLTRIRGYIIFKDEIDALQVRLFLEQKAQRVTLWPAYLRFTIHELVEDES